MEQVEKDVEAALQNVSSLLNVHSHFFLYSSSVLPAVPDDSSLYLYLLMPILDSVTATARGANYLTIFPMKDTLRSVRGSHRIYVAKGCETEPGLRFIVLIREDY